MDKNQTFESYCTKRVSFILPHKNQAAILDKALMRCREFKGPDDELIIMDGGSEDNTKDIVEKYSDLIDVFISEPDTYHPNLDQIHPEHKKDPLNAVNKGFLVARGKYLKTIATDDIYHPEGIKKAIEVLERHPEIDLLICGGTRERYGRVEYTYLPPGINFGKSLEDVFNYGSGCGVGHFFRKSALAKAGLHPLMIWKPNSEEVVIGPDFEYALKFLASGANVKFCRINAFHSPWSHYNFSSLGLVGEQMFNCWMSAARRYCSKSFYFRYLIKRKIDTSYFFRKFYSFIKKIRRHINNKGIKKFLGKKMSSTEYIWDGGFS